MILADVATFLKASSAIADLIGARVFAGAAPQNAEWPRIVISKISNPPSYTLSGEAGYSVAQIQVDAWAKDTNGQNGLWQAERLAAAIQNRMSGYRGTMGATTVRTATIVRNNDETIEPKNASDAKKYRVSMDFDIFYLKAVPDFT